MKKISLILIVFFLAFGLWKGLSEYNKYKKEQNQEKIKSKKAMIIKKEVLRIDNILKEENFDYELNQENDFLVYNIKIENPKKLEINSDVFELLKNENKWIFRYENKKIIEMNLKYFNLKKLAILIDDVGMETRTAYKFLEITEKLNFATIPFLPRTKEATKILKDAGYNIILHMPMESLSNESLNKKTVGLIRTNMSEKVIRNKFQEAIDGVGEVRGFNNHMGSKFTSNSQKMKELLRMAKEKNMFFVDSVTIGRTVGYKIAKEMGIKTIKRSVFLDNKNELQAIKEQIKKSVQSAKKNGKALVIGHYRPLTAQAIKEMIPYIKKEKVTLVFVEDVLE